MAAATGVDPIDLCTPPRIVETIEPDAALAPAYQHAWGQYRSLYPALKEALAS
jgi:xylulokinase